MKKICIMLLMVITTLFLPSCSKNEKMQIYNISDAYSLNMISKDELQEFANYYNNITNSDESIDNKLHISELDSKTIKKIKKAYLNAYIKADHVFATTNSVDIKTYYGTYGNCTIVFVKDTFFQCDIYYVPEYEIDGIMLYNYCLNDIKFCIEV